MDNTERTVQLFLQNLGLGLVVYEPDGNTPPDFSADRRIAVEARRLNEHEEVGGAPRGLEITAIPLRKTVVKLLRQSGPPHASQSCYLHYTVLRRPVPGRKELQRLLSAAVQQFREQLAHPPSEIIIGSKIRLEFTPAERQYDTLLVPGIASYDDSGCQVVPELLRNLRICVDEKRRKIAPFRHKYPEWWLAFEDRIAFGALYPIERVELRTALGVVTDFARILLIDPQQPTRGLDLLVGIAD